MISYIHTNMFTYLHTYIHTYIHTFCFVYPPYEVAMPSRQNVRNARSRALRALETPEETLVRREIRNEKDRARRRAKTKQKQVAK